MKSLALMLFVVLMSLSTVAFAQSDAQPAALSLSEAEESFAAVKALAGEWEGVVEITEMPEMRPTMHVSIRVTS